MRPGSHTETPTVSAVVRRAVAICDPNGDDELLADFLRTHEDRDEPIAGFEQRDRIFFEAAERLRGTMLDPGLEMAAAVATYLAYRRDELTDSDADILRLAARAEFGAHPPDDVAGWLRDAGVTP